MKRRISYLRERIDYKNIVGYGNIVEAVIFKTPDLSYKFQIFILQNGVFREKLYRKNLSGAKKAAYKWLGLVHKNMQPVFFENDNHSRTRYFNFNKEKKNVHNDKIRDAAIQPSVSVRF